MKPKNPQPTLGDIAAQDASERNEEPPAALRSAAPMTLADFGIDASEVGASYWHPPDARERDQPIRIVERLDDRAVPWNDPSRKKTLPNGTTVTVLAKFKVIVYAEGTPVERVWECLSKRALQALCDVADLGQWFTIKSRGSGTEKLFTAKAYAFPNA